MARPIDAFLYVGYMRSRWRLIAASCGIAVLLSVVFSLIQTREYTATARIVIEPPAGSDLHTAMAVSPIYLESLHTYEEFVESDNLFRKALDHLDLRSLLGARPFESLKKRVLKVNLVRNTRILEISATLPEAHKSQALAKYLAESTVDLNRSLVADSDRDLLHGLDQQVAEARAHMDRLDAQWAHLLSTEPLEDLKSSTESDADLRARLLQQILSFEVEVVDGAQREKESADRDKSTGSAEAAQLRADTLNAQMRIAEMRKQLQDLDRKAADRAKLLALRVAHRDKVEAERKSAQAGLASIEARMREASGEAGFRGERLQIIDPGVVPERPSSPNLPLNIATALLAGMVLPILYLALALNFLEQRAVGRRDVFEPALKGRRDEGQ